jgi:hypothetical protein
MSKHELARFIADTQGDGALEDQARVEGTTPEALVTFAKRQGYDVKLSDLPAAARAVRGNTIGGVGGPDRFGFWGTLPCTRE